MKQVMHLTAKEKAAIVRKVRSAARARADAIGRAPDPGFAERERRYLAAHPHLANHKHCQLINERAGAGRTRKGEKLMGTSDGKNPKPKLFTATPVKLPNGRTMNFFWYKPDGYTTAGKVAKYVPTAAERAAFRRLESAYARGLRNQARPL